MWPEQNKDQLLFLHGQIMTTLIYVQNDEEVGVLLMDVSGSVGLDLSFASHVFLLEPIEDMSLHKQVVARAHRMGAKQPINAEILVMKVTLLYLANIFAATDDALTRDTLEGNCHMSARHDWSNLSIKRLWRFHWACHVEVAGRLHRLTQLSKFWISSLRSESDYQLLHNTRHLCDAVSKLSYIRSKAGSAWYDAVSRWIWLQE